MFTGPGRHAFSLCRITSTRLALVGVAGVLAIGGCQAFDKPDAKAPKPTIADRTVFDPRPTTVNTPEEISSALISLNNGETLRSQGLANQALIAFERAIAENPKLVPAYMQAGDIYRERGDHSSAQQRYAQAAEIDPTNFSAHYNNGLMLQLLDRISESVVAYIRALRLSPDDFKANMNLATAYLQLKEPDKAVPYAEHAVEIDGRNAPARVNLGVIYSQLARYDQAILEYQQAAELTPLTPTLLMNMAQSLSGAKRYEEMANTLEQLIREEPSAGAYERLGYARFKLGEMDAAETAFGQATKIDENYTPALNGLGVVSLNRWIKGQYADDAMWRKGTDLLRRSLEIDRNQPLIVELLTRYQQQ
ncbi:MAG: tetratricopeptide repeat protein [Phycisphaerales bacterium]